MRSAPSYALTALVLVLLHAGQMLAAPQMIGSAGTIRGLVVDERTAQPLAKVRVRLADTEVAATTGSDGRFELRGIAPGDYTMTASVVGYALVRRAITVAPQATLTFTIVLTAGAGTYEERVDVVAPVFETREPGTVAEQTIGAAELQDLRGLVADDPLRAIQVLPGVTATDDFSAEFSARGSGPRNTAVVLDGIPAAAVLLHAVEGRDDSGSIARINSDVLARASLFLGSYPQRYGDRLGPQLEFLTRDGSRDGFHLRGTVSTIAAAGIGEGPLAGGRGSWLVSLRQSYLDWIIRALHKDYNGVLGFTDAVGKIVFDVSGRHRASLTVLGGRSHYEERDVTPGPNSLGNAVSRGGLAIAGLHSTSGTWLLNQRVFVLANRSRNQRADGADLGQGRHTEFGYRADISRQIGSYLALEFGGHAQRMTELQAIYEFGRQQPPRRTTIELYDQHVTQEGGYVNLRWQPTPRFVGTAGARLDGTSATRGLAASPWVQIERRLSHGFMLRAGSGVYRQSPSAAQIAGLHGGGDTLGVQRAYHVDLGLEQARGTRTRWQVSVYNRDERDIVWAPGLEPRASGAPTLFNPAAKYLNRLRGYARGVEAVAQRRDPNGLSGWIAYAYGRSWYTDPVTGEAFPGDYDQRHTLNAYASLRLSSRTTAVGKFRIGSNVPLRGYYRATGAEDADGLPLFVSGPVRNAGRLPTYARLDLRLNQVFNFSTRRLTLFVETINVLDRTNAGPSGGRTVEKLLPFVPAAGFLVEFED